MPFVRAFCGTFFSFCESLKERVTIQSKARVCQGLYLRLSLILACLECRLLALFEQGARKELSLAMAANLVELADETSVLKVEEVFVGALGIEVILIVCETVKVGVEVLFVIVDHRLINKQKI